MTNAVVHIKSPSTSANKFLSTFAGQTEPARVQHGSWMDAWRRFGWLPELFDISIAARHPLEKVAASSCVWTPAAHAAAPK